MKKLFSITALVLSIVIVMSPLPVNAQMIADNNDSVGTRTEEEIQELKNIYQTLFPNEYKYVVDYESNGLSLVDNDDLMKVFEDTRNLGDTDYTLTVFSNGQVFFSDSSIIPTNSINAPGTQSIEEDNQVGIEAYDTYQETKVFHIGDPYLNKFVDFTMTYTIYLLGYDHINSYSTSGTGFSLNILNRRYKQWENSSGNAYYAFYNCQIEGGLTLFDLGVLVGNNTAKSFIRLSSGLDSFLWYILNATI